MTDGETEQPPVERKEEIDQPDGAKQGNEAQNELVDLILEFVKRTIVGHERGTYRFMASHHVPLEGVKTDAWFKAFLIDAAVNYFNLAYKSLIRRDDPYICGAFDRMHQLHDHSYICLLNIVFATTINLHGSMDRSVLEHADLETFEESVMCALTPLLAAARARLQ